MHIIVVGVIVAIIVGIIIIIFPKLYLFIFSKYTYGCLKYCDIWYKMYMLSQH